MSVIHDLTTAVSAIERLKKHRADLNNRASAIDKTVNDHYHVIELLPLNAAELSKITKSLRTLLKERREVKEQVIAVSNFLASQVDGVKAPEVSEKNAQQREAKYRNEALLVYEKIFGKKKVHAII